MDLVTSLYGKALNASKEVQGDLIGLRLMEETANRNDGNRYMLEMDVQLHKPMVFYTWHSLLYFRGHPCSLNIG